jgi:splicing factor 3A subunit 1
VQDKEAQEAADAEDAERMALLSIDWQDFVVVATIDFDEGEDAGLPGPMTLKQIRQMARASTFVEENGAKTEEESKKATGGAGMDAEERDLVAQGQGMPSVPTAADSGDVDMELSDEEEAAPMRVVKDYRRQDVRSAAMAAGGGYDPSRYVVSPITGELVPIEQMEEHMRVSLIDPKWKQQKDTMLAKIKETTKASDDEIGRNLALLARTRPDVFGADAATVSSAVHRQIESERTGDKAPPMPPPAPAAPPAWPPTAAPPPPPIHAVPPVPVPDKAPIPPPPTSAPPPPPSVSQQVPLPPPEKDGIEEEEEQDAKRRRIDGGLVLAPEADFVAQHPGQRVIRVQCPDVASNSALHGQLLEVEVPSLLENVQSLKERISGAVGLAVNKLRLGREGVGILVDALSLGHYNVDGDVVLQLSIKERGGRKK